MGAIFLQENAIFANNFCKVAIFVHHQILIEKTIITYSLYV